MARGRVGAPRRRRAHLRRACPHAHPRTRGRADPRPRAGARPSRRDPARRDPLHGSPRVRRISTDLPGGTHMAGVGLQLNYESPTSLEVDSARSWVLKPDVSRVLWLLPAAMTPQTPRVSALSRALTGVLAVCVLSMISCSESVEHSGAAIRVAALTCSPPTIDMKLLVISNGKAESDFPAIQQVLDYFGTPYDVLDMSVNTAGITSTMLSDGSCHGYYQGVIFAFGGYIYTLPGMATL